MRETTIRIRTDVHGRDRINGPGRDGVPGMFPLFLVKEETLSGHILLIIGKDLPDLVFKGIP